MKTITQYQKISHAGRSMIEMIGVLSIIGVLTVAGISGYEKAMAKYKMNKLINQFSLLQTTMRQHFARSNESFTTDDLIELGIFDGIFTVNKDANECYSWPRCDGGKVITAINKNIMVISDVWNGAPSYNIKLRLGVDDEGKSNCINFLTSYSFGNDLVGIDSTSGFDMERIESTQEIAEMCNWCAIGYPNEDCILDLYFSY